VTMARWDVVRARLAGRHDGRVDQALWRKIEATRSRGVTVDLPRERSQVLPRLGLYAGGVGAVALAFGFLNRNSAPEVLATSPIDWGWPLLPEAAFAQGTSAPHLRPIGAPDGSRLKPGRLVYAWTTAHEDHPGDFPKMADTITIQSGTLHDETAWLITQSVRRDNGRGGGRLDSLYLRLSDLRPLRTGLFLYRSDRLQKAMAMDFAGDSVVWQFRVPGSGSPGRDTVVIAQLPASYAAVWPGFPFVLNGIQFTKGWARAVPMLVLSIDWSHGGSLMPVNWINLRVTGLEQITVPAGRFECWRLVATISPDAGAGTVSTLWVDSMSGVLVKEAAGNLSYSTAGRELAAILP
jgi:hypothetical protein